MKKTNQLDYVDNEMKRSDIRRMMRNRAGVVLTTLTQLARALKARNKYLAGSSVLIVGCEMTDTDDTDECMALKTAIEDRGASVYAMDHTATSSASEYLSALKKLSPMVDAVIIDTETPYFRWLRPKEARSFGLDVVIPTSLHA